MNPPNDLAALAADLFHAGAVRFGAFKLKLHETHPDAPLSPIYLNLRSKTAKNPGPLGNDLFERVCRTMAERVKDVFPAPDHVCGVPHAGDPYAVWLAVLLGRKEKPMGLIRLNKKESDARRAVTNVREGVYAPGESVLLVDDLVTKADTKLEAIRSLEAAGLVVRDVVVLVDRCQGGSDELANAGYCVHSVFRLPDLLALLRLQGHVDGETVDRVLAYIRSS